MYTMQAFVKERFPDESKIWRYPANALVTVDDYVSFGYIGETKKLPTVAEVSWRHDLQRISAQYVLSNPLVGIARDHVKTRTPIFDVLGFETTFEGNMISHRNLIFGRSVIREEDVEVIPVPLGMDGSITPFVLGNADLFMYERVSRIEDADQIARLKMIG